MQWEKINVCVQKWMKQARKMILEGRTKELCVEEKTSRCDLVTNVDKFIEKFYVERIRETFPNSKILGEEGDADKDLDNFQGLLWIIDPIDGTMNFVKQHDHFASMIAICENGTEKLGYILDVTEDKLYWGGPECGVFCNNQKMAPPGNLPLEEGLFGVGGRMLLSNYRNVQSAAKKSLGVRIYGSSGIEFIHVLTGKNVSYLSHLRPWDYAAGKILAETLGLVVKTIDEEPLDMLSSSDVLVATKNAHQVIVKLMNS